MKNDIYNLELEILEYSYQEHFKYLRDVSLILPIEHPKRIKVEKEVNELIIRINNIKNK